MAGKQSELEIADRHKREAIIKGARGTGALRSALRGSLSLAVLHASPVPVAIVQHLPAGN